MLDVHGIHYLAVLVAWLLNLALGAYWYSPIAFGPLWSRLSGVDMMKIAPERANKIIGSIAIGSLIQTIVLAVVINSLYVTDIVDALIVGLVLWLGFTAVTTIGNNLYMGKSWKFWCLNAAFFMVVMPLNAVLLAVWQ